MTSYEMHVLRSQHVSPFVQLNQYMETGRLTRKTAYLMQNATDDTDTTSKSAQGPRNLKKEKTSNKKAEDPSNGGQPTRSRTKGKKGSVKFAHDIPFDVLLEIFRLLEPIDLLHLSRLSKNLYASLTSKEVWQSAYENVPSYHKPPLCPDDTNIVFYTNFLYGRHCQFCASIYGRIYHESVFIRLCLKCANKSFIKLKREDPVCRLCNKWSFPKCKGLVTSKTEGILKEEYDLRLEEFKQAHKSKTVKRYVEARTIAPEEHSSIAFYISIWRQRIQQNQINTLNMMREKREADIRNKLKEEGFEADSNRIGDYNLVPHARKPHPLTDSEWSVIRADILDFFQDIREKKALADMRCEIRRLIAKLEQFILQWKIRPTAWWIASSEPIASFMKSESEEISKKEFKGVEVEIRNLITSWQEEMDRYLATLIPQPSRKGKKNTFNSETTGLELATTSFKCHRCTEPIAYPRILMHACLRNDRGNEGDAQDVEEDVVVNPRTRGQPRQPRPPMKITLGTVLPMLSGDYRLGMFPGRARVTFHKEAFKSARDIITICGEDPNTVTYAEMEGSATRLECLRCSWPMREKPKAESDRLVMKWNTAIVHELEEHHDEASSLEPVWRKIDSEEDLDKIEGEESYMKTVQEHQGRQVFVKYRPLVDASIKMLYPAVKI